MQILRWVPHEKCIRGMAWSNSKLFDIRNAFHLYNNLSISPRFEIYMSSKPRWRLVYVAYCDTAELHCLDEAYFRGWQAHISLRVLNTAEDRGMNMNAVNGSRFIRTWLWMHSFGQEVGSRARLWRESSSEVKGMMGLTLRRLLQLSGINGAGSPCTRF